MNPPTAEDHPYPFTTVNLATVNGALAELSARLPADADDAARAAARERRASAIVTLGALVPELVVELELVRSERDDLFAAIKPDAADVDAAIEALRLERGARSLLARIEARRGTDAGDAAHTVAPLPSREAVHAGRNLRAAIARAAAQYPSTSAMEALPGLAAALEAVEGRVSVRPGSSFDVPFLVDAHGRAILAPESIARIVAAMAERPGPIEFTDTGWYTDDDGRWIRKVGEFDLVIFVDSSLGKVCWRVSHGTEDIATGGGVLDGEYPENLESQKPNVEAAARVSGVWVPR